ncbi:hypothetical protein Q9966_003219 [Columba livia]|nr:hypothetical protein Q9966_003219 [Columba livia]
MRVGERDCCLALTKN